MGLVGGYAHSSADVKHGYGDARMDSYSAGAYMTYHNADGIYADGMVNGGWDHFETFRRINIPAFERQAHSEHDGTHWDARLGAGWMKRLGYDSHQDHHSGTHDGGSSGAGLDGVRQITPLAS